jgi:hypothetical protein
MLPGLPAISVLTVEPTKGPVVFAPLFPSPIMVGACSPSEKNAASTSFGITTELHDGDLRSKSNHGPATNPSFHGNRVADFYLYFHDA